MELNNDFNNKSPLLSSNKLYTVSFTNLIKVKNILDNDIHASCKLNKDNYSIEDASFNSEIIDESQSSIDSSFNSSILTQVSNIDYNLNNNSSNKEVFDYMLINALKSSLGLIYCFIHDSTNLIVIGKLNSYNYLSGVGIAMFYQCILCLSIVEGYLSGIGVLISNAFVAKRYKLVGKHYILCRLIVTFYFILIYIPLTIFFSYILFNKVLNLDDATSNIAYNYNCYMIVSSFFNVQFLSVYLYQISINMYDPGMYISTSVVVFYPFLCYFIFYYLNLREIGLAIASTIFNLVVYILLELYNQKKNIYQSTLIGFSNYIAIPKNQRINKKEKNEFIALMKNNKYYKTYIHYVYYKIIKSAYLKSNLRLGLHCTLTTLVKFLGGQILSVYSCLLGTVPLAANTCFSSIINNFYLIQIGIANTTRVLSGNAYEYKQERLLNNISKISNYVSIVYGLILICTMFLFSKDIYSFYTNNHLVNEALKPITYIYSMYCLFDCYSNTFESYLCGIGKQKEVLYISSFYYIIFNSILITFLSNIYNTKLSGIYIGYAITIILKTVTLNLYYLRKINLKKYIENNENILLT